MKADRGLTIERMVELGGVSRAGFYRHAGDCVARPNRDMDLRDAIQRVALEWPSYGRPRITAELRRRGWVVNPKRVYRLMREDNLLCVPKRKFVVTTDSDHDRKVYPNLAGEMILTDIDQLWVADITYIRLQSEFVYLAVVIDAFSRRVVGWALDVSLEDDLPFGGPADGAGTAAAGARARASFRSRQPVCLWRLHRSAESPRLPNQHEPQVEPLGKCRM
jgi:putative transposase